MGLFDKKYCDVCGEKIGLLGNRKLEDGNLCKDCAKKLSPWFNERRHSTLDEIKQQLAYREENKNKVSQFRVTRTLGDEWKVMFDENNRWFAVTRLSRVSVDENPDILDFSAISSCRLDIDEDKSEVYRETENGKESYNPPRYEYDYNFDIVINVANPYFDEIKFRLNSGTVHYEPEPAVQISLFGRSLTSDTVNPENCMEYCKYRDMGQGICYEIDRVRGVNTGYAQTPAYGQQNAQPYAPANGGYAQAPANGYAQAPANGYAQAPAYGQQNAQPFAAAGVGYAQTPAYGQQPVQPAQQYGNTAPATGMGAWICPNCGRQSNGKFCEGCGSPMPAQGVIGCASCGWKPAPGQPAPKFCPQCGRPLA